MKVVQVRDLTPSRGPAHLPGVDEQAQEGRQEDSQQHRQDGNDDHCTRALEPWGSLEGLG